MDPLKEAHVEIDGIDVAQMILDFHRSFSGIYPAHVMQSSLCAVGPLQSMIGHAIKNGLLTVGPKAIRSIKL